MPSNVFVGEFEQLVLLSLLHLGESGAVLALRERMEQSAGRTVRRRAGRYPPSTPSSSPSDRSRA